MKLPRWLLIGLWISSVLAVLAGAGWFGWWWVTWPERTAREFLSVWSSRGGEEAKKMVQRSARSNQAFFFIDEIKGTPSQHDMAAFHRSTFDLVLGRQDFKFSGGTYKLRVERGSVVHIAWWFES